MNLSTELVLRVGHLPSCGEGAEFPWDCTCDYAGAIERLQAAIATLALVDEYLASIERGFAHWEDDHPRTGEHRSGDPKVVILSREQWLEPTKRLRASLEVLR
jgi:hypothetical protein